MTFISTLTWLLTLCNFTKLDRVQQHVKFSLTESHKPKKEGEEVLVYWMFVLNLIQRASMKMCICLKQELLMHILCFLLGFFPFQQDTKKFLLHALNVTGKTSSGNRKNLIYPHTLGTTHTHTLRNKRMSSLYLICMCVFFRCGVF